MELLNIHFNFICRSTYSNKSGQQPIILRIIYQGERRDLFTGLYCHKAHWDNNSNSVTKLDKTYRTINENLQLILKNANQNLDQLKFSGVIFTLQDLVDRIKGNDAKPDQLFDLLEEVLMKIREREGVDISKATYLKYRRTIELVKEFVTSRYKSKNLSLNKIDPEFLNEFFLYLRKEKDISHNVVLRYFQFFKSFLLPSIRSGSIKHDPFLQVKQKKHQTFVAFLSKEELDQVANAEFESPDLERIRDIFLFACYTGLAYIDIKQLSRNDIIVDTDGTLYIRKPRQKTGQESIIPLLSPAIQILKKYTVTGELRDLGWYVSSNQKMNKGLKKIGQKAAIKKELHMHLARHTFATTVTLSNGIPLETVSHMLGHASIKQTQHYARIVAGKVKNEMKKLNTILFSEKPQE